MQDLIFLLGRELSWSKLDLREFLGHELIMQVKRLTDWKKKNPQVCPLMGSKG